MNEPKLSAYEQLRLDKIARNEKRLEELGLHDAKTNLHDATQGRDTATQPKKIKTCKRNDEDTKRSPTRRSPRCSKVAAGNNDDNDEDYDPAVSSSEDNEPQKKKRRSVGIITDKICKVVGSAVSKGKTYAASIDNFLGETVVNCLAGTINKCDECGEDTIRGQDRCSACDRPKPKKCRYCNNNAYKGGICVSHGAKRHQQKKCEFIGCTNKAVKGGICVRHGAKVAPPKKCGNEGCTNFAVKGGVCCSHGATVAPRKLKLCNHPGCPNLAQKGGICIKHGM